MHSEWAHINAPLRASHLLTLPPAIFAEPLDAAQRECRIVSPRTGAVGGEFSEGSPAGAAVQPILTPGDASAGWIGLTSDASISGRRKQSGLAAS